MFKAYLKIQFADYPDLEVSTLLSKCNGWVETQSPDTNLTDFDIATVLFSYLFLNFFSIRRLEKINDFLVQSFSIFEESVPFSEARHYSKKKIITIVIIFSS